MNETSQTGKNRVFLSWSGNRSRSMAEAFHAWLPRVLPLVDPWISQNIPKGSEWRRELMNELRKAGAAIACLTAQNLRSEWLNFEAGVAATTDPEKYRLYPVVLDSETVSRPLKGLQITRSWDRLDVKRLVRDLNSICEPQLPGDWIDRQVDLLWNDLADGIHAAKQQVPDKAEDYDDAIRNISQYLHNLQQNDETDIITFYVRDYATPREAIDYYLESHHGLRDPAPMFGPIVHDDFRNKKEREDFKGNKEAKMAAAAAEVVAGRAKKFIARESIVANATFRHFDSEGDVRALLNLNWRSAQDFRSEPRKQRLREIADAVFGLLPDKPFISLERTRTLTKELRARRYLGAAELDGHLPSEPQIRIRQALSRFFGPDEHEIDIHIVALDNDSALKWEERGSTAKACTVEPDWKWVQETTKPLFYDNIDVSGSDSTPISAMIIPMRVPPGLRTCSGIIMIREREDAERVLESRMVRPLCSLGDTFSEILRTGK